MTEERTYETNSHLLMSRRSFLYGTAAAGATAALAMGLTGCNAMAGNDEVAYLEVPESSLVTLDDFQELENPDGSIHLVDTFDLPYGTLVWVNDNEVAACLLPTSTGSPLTQVGLLWFGSGSLDTVLQRAVGTVDHFEIYDVRATSNGIVWTEANVLQGLWRVYTAKIGGGTIDGEPQLLLHDGTSVSVRALEAMLRNIPGRVVVLIDCCQSGAFIGSAASALYAESAAAIFTDSPLLNGKYLVMTSCGAEEDSYRISDTGENTEADMSTVFARALCEGLGWDLDNDRSVSLRADNDRDGAVTFTELWLYTRRRVYYHLSGTGVSQTVMAWPDINESPLFTRQFS